MLAVTTSAGSPAPPAIPNVLVVCVGPHWLTTLREAATDIASTARVSVCGVRCAVRRLTTPAHGYSHLLVEPTQADRFMSTLVELTAHADDQKVQMWLLGDPPAAPPRQVRVIAGADPSQIRRALMAPPVPTDHEARSMQLSDLRAALADGMIVARYQPIVRLADRVPTLLEALARLSHPRHGTLMPDDFVPQLEDAGLASDLTDAVAARTFSDLADIDLAPLGLDVSLNFPLDVLLVPEAMVRLEAQRRAKGIAASRVVIELTESRPVQDLPALGRALERLGNAGYRIAIDDVGPNVPQISKLVELPFTGVKLDKDLVQQIDRNAQARKFAEEIIEVSRRRGLTLVAEGVEDVATWQLLKAMGVELAQGFLLARALPAPAVPLWLEDWRKQADFD